MKRLIVDYCKGNGNGENNDCTKRIQRGQWGVCGAPSFLGRVLSRARLCAADNCRHARALSRPRYKDRDALLLLVPHPPRRLCLALLTCFAFYTFNTQSAAVS